MVILVGSPTKNTANRSVIFNFVFLNEAIFLNLFLKHAGRGSESFLQPGPRGRNGAVDGLIQLFISIALFVFMQ